MKPVIIIAIAVAFLFVPPNVFAEESLINVQTDNANYEEGDIVVISGNVSIIIGSTPVTFQLFLDESLVDIAQITVAQDGTYSHTVIAEGPLWKNTGDYLVRVSYGEGNIAETEFSYTPKSKSIEITTIFEVDWEGYGTFDVEYTIKGGTVIDMIVDPEGHSIIVRIESTDSGTISLDLPRDNIGSTKQDGKDDTFITLINGIEVAYQESVIHLDSRVITINFEEGDSDIEIIGTYVAVGVVIEQTMETPTPTPTPTPTFSDESVPMVYVIAGIVIAVVAVGIGIALSKRKKTLVIAAKPAKTQTVSEVTQFWVCPNCGRDTQMKDGRQYCSTCKIYLSI